MAVCFSILLLLSGVTGICSIATVSKVSVKTGKSISIPCLYSSEDTDKVKLLCKGSYWYSCTFVVQTNQPQNSDKFSITDDKTQRIFTVTISKLETSNSGFWCAVSIGKEKYIAEDFSLSVTTGNPSLYTDKQNYTGYIGESITITFYSKDTRIKKWCRLGGPCVTDRSHGAIYGTTVTINTFVRGEFTVTMSELRSESEGWYYSEAGDFQMPVYIRVINKPTIAATTITAGKPETTGTTGDSEKQEIGPSFDLKFLLIPLGLLILIVTPAISIWLILQRRHAKAEASATTEDEVTYTSVVFVNSNSTQTQRGDAREVDSLYSSVIPKRKRAVSAAEDVTYSTLAET